MAYRRRHEDDAGGVNLGMVITPMLDMSFQLMAFFIMTYHPSDLEGRVEGKLLPPTKTASAGPGVTKKDEKDAPPIDVEPPDPKETIRVLVRKVSERLIVVRDDKGEPERDDKGEVVHELEQVLELQLKRPDKTDLESIADRDTPFETGLKRLKTAMENLYKGPGGSNLNAIVEPEPSVLFKYFIQVQGTCKAAGFKSVGFAAPVGP